MSTSPDPHVEVTDPSGYVWLCLRKDRLVPFQEVGEVDWFGL